MSLSDWIGIHERPEGFRLTENQTHPLRNGLVFAGLGGGYCPKSLRFHDSSLYGNHGTLTNMDPATDWVWSNELGRWLTDHDGTDDYITTGKTFNTSAVTYAAWAKLPAAVSFNEFIMIENTADGRGIGVDAPTAKWFAFNDRLFSSAVVNYGTWTHVAYAHNGTTGWLYINGTLNASASFSLAAGGAFLIGSYGTLASNNVWSGQISDPMMWRRDLTNSEVAIQADPSNVMLSGLLMPPRRRIWAAVAVTGWKPYFARPQSRVYSGGVS